MHDGPTPASTSTLTASDEAAASTAALRRSALGLSVTHSDGTAASELEGLMAEQAVWFFCGHADASLDGRRTLAFA